MRNIIIVFTLLLIALSCTNIKESTTPAPPCSDPLQCLSIYVSQNVVCCTGKPTGKVYLANNNPSREISAIIIEETLIANEVYELTDILSLDVLPTTSVEIGCSWDNNNACTQKKRYRPYKAKFIPGSYITESPVSNPDLPKLDCLSSCKTTTGTCTGIDFKTLPPDQQKAIIECYTQILKNQSNHLFTSNLMKIFVPNPKDIMCNDRIDRITNHIYSSEGSTCELKPLLPNPIQLLGTNDTYTNMFIKFPSVVLGKMTKNANVGTVDFETVDGASVYITVQLDKSKQLRNDMLHSITARGYDKKLIISGRDFICLTIFNINDGK